MRIVQLDQSGPDWHKWRAQGLGGSDAPTIMNENPYQCGDELVEVKKGRKKIRENKYMAKGKRLEPTARVRYMEMTGLRVRPVCVQNDHYDWLRASLDGLSEDNLTILEIKCPSSPRGHETALARRVPSYYWAQVQHQLACVGYPERPEGLRLHFFSFWEEANPDRPQFPPEQQVALVKVVPDWDYIGRLVRQEQRFWDRLQKEVEIGEGS